MHLHYLTLMRQAEFLHSTLKGCRIQDSYTFKKNEWNLVLAARDETYLLWISVDGAYPGIVLYPFRSQPRQTVPVFNELVGKTIEDIAILPEDRIIKITVRESPEQLLVQFFTHHSNVFWVDKDQIILRSFKKSREMSGRRYQVKKSGQFDFRNQPFSAFKKYLESRPEDAWQERLKGVRFLTPVLRRELLFRAQIAGDEPVGRLSPAEWERVYDALQQFWEELRTGRPVVYLKEEAPFCLTLGTFVHLQEYSRREFDDLNSALKYFLGGARRFRSRIELRDQLLRQVQRQLKRLRRTASSLQKGGLSQEKQAFYQRAGQLIASQPHLFLPGKSKIELVDYYDPEMSTLSIPVDPKLSARENARRYFQKAENLARRQQEYQLKLERLQTDIERLSEFERQILAAQNQAELEKLEKQLRDANILKDDPAAEQVSRPFKTYPYKGFEIWVGKDAAKNDQMTFKWAHKEDFWLHVQGYSGSYVIIRNPGRLEQIDPQVIEFAARLAVTFSAAKHAAYLPVMITRVKFLRKPRKSAPGTVIPTQIRTIYVDPFPGGNIPLS